MKQLRVPYFALEIIADKKGFFRRYNLDVEFVTQVAQGVAGVPAIVSNQVQTGQGFGVNTPLQARAGGAKLKAVVAGLTSAHGDYRYYSLADGNIRTAKDLVGKTVGIVTVGAYPDVALQVWLYRNGVPLNQVTRIQVPLNAMCDALLRKQVDVVGMYSLFYFSCEKNNQGKLRLLFKDNDVTPSAKLYSAYVFTDDYIKSNPGVIRAYVAALKDATRFVQNSPGEAKQLVSEATGIAAELVYVPAYSKGNCIDLVAAAQWTKLFTDFNVIQRGSVKGTEWVTNAFNPGCPQTIKQQLALEKKAKAKK